jgi:beta-phosphoglucomutase family hydrolase
MNNHSITALIFDMDGTMVDNMAIHNQTWIDYLAEIGVQADPQTFNDRTAGKTTPDILRLFLGQQLSDAETRAISHEKENRYREQFQRQARPLPGLLDLLHATRRAGLRLGVATSAPPENVAVVLEALGLEGFFDALVHGNEIVRGKPDPEIFLTAAARLQTPPERCLVFEDSRLGIEAARRAGMRAVVITTGIPAGLAREIPGVRKAIGDFTHISVEEIMGYLPSN